MVGGALCRKTSYNSGIQPPNRGLTTTSPSIAAVAAGFLTRGCSCQAVSRSSIPFHPKVNA